MYVCMYVCRSSLTADRRLTRSVCIQFINDKMSYNSVDVSFFVMETTR